MSRSKRKPIVKDGYGSPSKSIAKRSANRCVRNSKELAKGSHYKKEYCSWNIADYRWDLRFEDESKLTKKQKALKIRK